VFIIYSGQIRHGSGPHSRVQPLLLPSLNPQLFQAQSIYSCCVRFRFDSIHAPILFLFSFHAPILFHAPSTCFMRLFCFMLLHLFHAPILFLHSFHAPILLLHSFHAPILFLYLLHAPILFLVKHVCASMWSKGVSSAASIVCLSRLCALIVCLKWSEVSALHKKQKVIVLITYSKIV
jgi:hypothetical protein